MLVFTLYILALQRNRLHEVVSVLLHGVTDKIRQLFCDFIDVEDDIFYFFEVTLKTVEILLWCNQVSGSLLVVWFRVCRRFVSCCCLIMTCEDRGIFVLSKRSIDHSVIVTYSRRLREATLGARDFSSAVAGFSQVFIVTRAKRFFRGFGLHSKMCRPSANTENSRRTLEKPLVPRVTWNRCCNRVNY